LNTFQLLEGHWFVEIVFHDHRYVPRHSTLATSASKEVIKNRVSVIT